MAKREDGGSTTIVHGQQIVFRRQGGVVLHSGVRDERWESCDSHTIVRSGRRARETAKIDSSVNGKRENVGGRRRRGHNGRRMRRQ